MFEDVKHSLDKEMDIQDLAIYLALDDVYSFSRLASFSNCSHEYYLRRILREPYDNNFYSEFGSFIHEILMKYLKWEIKKENLLLYYNLSYDSSVKFCHEVKNPEKTKQAGYDYFLNFNFDEFLNDYKVLEVEKKFYIGIHNNLYVGIVDLVLQNKANNDIIIIDHKTSQSPFGKRGKILKKGQNDFDLFQKQLYIYSKYILDKYGVYPKQIGWNFIKENQIKLIDFNTCDYLATLEWVKNTRDEIDNCKTFLPNINYFYCNYLCGYRNKCCDYKWGRN